MQPVHSYAVLDEEYHYQADLQPTSILLIEDNRSDVVLVTRMLRDVSRNETFRITDVPRLAEALELLDTELFDIVLLDLNLLDIDGVAGVSALHAEIPNVPIIVYSGSKEHALREQAIMCGAKHFLVKGRESAFSLKFMIEQALIHQEA